MKRFQNILIVCDESPACDQAVARGVWLAQANGARVTLMDVNPAKPDTLARAFSSLSESRASEIAGQVQEYYGKLLEKHAETVRAAGVPVDTQMREGVAFIEIIRLVMTGEHDLVIKGALTSETGRGKLAGNDMHLLRKCPCPVWILHEGQPSTAQKILAAIDPDPNDDPQTSLNRVVMELASSLSVRDGAELHVIGAWRLQEETILRSGRFRMPESELSTILESERRNAEGRMADFLKDFPEPENRHVVVQKGFAGDIIPAYAAENGIDTIVMGTVGRTGVSGFFIGNTAETILTSVDCSVLTVKPPGFVSPVGLE